MLFAASLLAACLTPLCQCSTLSSTPFDDERRSFTLNFGGVGWSTGQSLQYAKQVVNVYVREFGQIPPVPVADMALVVIAQQTSISIDVLSNGEA